ncbi:MAG: cytochrome P450 [Anaerolineales bacterium]|nr:cytochrome P450 [Anaerolineales bacterium]
MKTQFGSIPTISISNALPILKDLAAQRSLLAGMEAMHQELGNIFEINLPGFKPVVLSGPEASREVLVTKRQQFKWRNASDPVTRLLRHGLLVEDGAFHETLRGIMQPALQRSQVNRYLPAMLACTDRVMSTWQDGSIQDMLVEMRRLALMILMETLFSVDISSDLPWLWDRIMRVLEYISPGLWLINSNLPRPGYQKAIKELDEYIFTIIRDGRLNETGVDDMLGELINREEMDDDLIRDQILTMLIAGHDTSTALLSWALYLISLHPEVMDRAREEVDQRLKERVPTIMEINQLHYLDQIIKETLRLYPPIHAGNRIADTDLNLQGCAVPKGTRVLLSFYLTHRDEESWLQSDRFKPERFDRNAPHKQPPFSYLPFGGGPRNCIGAAFAQIEAKLILAWIIQTFDLELVSPKVNIHMGATLEPKPGILIRVTRRSKLVNQG